VKLPGFFIFRVGSTLCSVIAIGWHGFISLGCCVATVAAQQRLPLVMFSKLSITKHIAQHGWSETV
jgi:hypothetical protein